MRCGFRRADADVTTLSGGEKRRVALCRMLLDQPDMLLLDEPTNHLDAESVAWLERYLAEFPGTVVAVTHDRYFLDNVAKWILELDRGAGIPYEGNYSVVARAEAHAARAGREAGVRAPAIAASASSSGCGMAPRARQAKSKARIQKYEELAASDTFEKVSQNEIVIPPPPRLGNDVVIAKDVRKSLRRQAAVRESDVLAAARRNRRSDRAERRRQDDAVPDDHRRGEAGSADDDGRRHGADRVRRSGARAERREHRVPGSERRARHDRGGEARDQRARVSRELQLPRAPISRRR